MALVTSSQKKREQKSPKIKKKGTFQLHTIKYFEQKINNICVIVVTKKEN